MKPFIFLGKNHKRCMGLLLAVCLLSTSIESLASIIQVRHIADGVEGVIATPSEAAEEMGFQYDPQPLSDDLAGISGSWAWKQVNSESYENYEDTTDLGEIAGYKQLSFPKYQADFLLNIPEVNHGYSIKLTLSQGWLRQNPLNSYFPKDVNGYITNVAYGPETEDTWSVVYTLNQEKTGSTGFYATNLCLDVNKMYPGMDLGIKAELLKDDSAISTQELSAQIKDYDQVRANFYMYAGSSVYSIPVSDPGAIANESSTGTMYIQLYKQGDLTGNNWGSTSSNYGDATMKFDVSKLKVDLSKLLISSTGASIKEPVTKEQLKALEIGGDYVKSYDPETGIITFKNTSTLITGASFTMKIKDWTAFARNDVPGKGARGHTYFYMDQGAEGLFEYGGQLYLNGLSNQLKAAVTLNTTANALSDNFVFNQIYTDSSTSVKVLRASKTFNSTWWFGENAQPLFRVALHTNHSDVNDLTFDLTIPSQTAITHIVVPAAKANYQGPITISYNGQDQEIEMGSTAAFVPLENPINGSESPTFTVKLGFLKENIEFGSSSNNIGLDFGALGGIEFFGSVEDTAEKISNRIAVSNVTGLYSKEGRPKSIVSSEQFRIIQPQQANAPAQLYFFTSQDGKPTGVMTGTARNPMYIGRPVYLRTYLRGSSNSDFPLQYGGNGEWKEPVLYVSLPPEFVTERGDYNFTKDDIVSYVTDDIVSVRRVDGLPGVNNGTLLEIKLADRIPQKWYEYVNLRYKSTSATSTAGWASATYNQTDPRSGYIYIKMMPKPDPTMFPDTNQTVRLKNTTLLGGTTSPERAAETYGTQKSVLSGAKNYNNEKVTNEFGIDSNGIYLTPYSDIVNALVRWPENVEVAASVDAKGDGTFISYIPDTTPNDQIPAMKAGATGKYRIQVRNESSSNMETTAGVIKFQLPKEQQSGRWQTTVISEVTPDGENTLDPAAVKVEYSSDGGNSYNETLPTGEGVFVTDIKLTFYRMPGGSIYSAVFDFTVPFVGNGVNYDEIAIGKTSYDLGKVGALEVKSDTGSTAALRLVQSDPPVVKPGIDQDNTDIEYKIDTGFPSWEELSEVTVTDDISQSRMGMAEGYPVMTFRPQNSTVDEKTTVISNQRKGVYTITYQSTADHDNQSTTVVRTFTVRDTRQDPLTLLQNNLEIAKGSSPSGGGSWWDYFKSAAFVIAAETQDPTDYDKMTIASISPEFDSSRSGSYQIHLEYRDPADNLSEITATVKVGTKDAIEMSPEITAADVVLKVGDAEANAFFWTKNVSVSDAEDDAAGKPLTPYVTKITDIYGNTSVYTKENQPSPFIPDLRNRYEVSYEVMDSAGNRSSDHSSIWVVDDPLNQETPWIAAPEGQTVSANVTVGYEFTVVNPGSSPVSLPLKADSSNNYQTEIVESNPLSVPGKGTTKVRVEIEIPKAAVNGTVDSLTLSTRHQNTDLQAVTVTTVDTSQPSYPIVPITVNWILVDRIGNETIVNTETKTDYETAVRTIESKEYPMVKSVFDRTEIFTIGTLLPQIETASAIRATFGKTETINFYYTIAKANSGVNQDGGTVTPGRQPELDITFVEEEPENTNIGQTAIADQDNPQVKYPLSPVYVNDIQQPSVPKTGDSLAVIWLSLLATVSLMTLFIIKKKSNK